jgi:hypothetical protein
MIFFLFTFVQANLSFFQALLLLKDLKDAVLESKLRLPSSLLLTMIPEEYNAELDTLLSCLESKIPPDLCLLSTPRT